MTKSNFFLLILYHCLMILRSERLLYQLYDTRCSYIVAKSTISRVLEPNWTQYYRKLSLTGSLILCQSIILDTEDCCKDSSVIITISSIVLEVFISNNT